MKRIMTICVAALLGSAVLTGCKDGSKGKVLDPNAKISIKAAAMPQSVASQGVPQGVASQIASKAEYPTPLEVVQKTTDIVLSNPKIGIQPSYNFGISEEQKDLTTPKIMMWGMWVIENNELSPTFIEAHDVIFVTREGMIGNKPISDTLAYIPNAQLRAAETAIKVAYAAENYDEVYKLFDQAYQFTPINGADWLELKRQGNN